MIYVIVGVCGHYSDRSEWYVCYRVSEADAEHLKAFLTSEANAYYAWVTAKGSGEKANRRNESFAGHTRRRQMVDPYFRRVYNDFAYAEVRYFVIPCPDDPNDGPWINPTIEPCGTCAVCRTEAQGCACDGSLGLGCWVCEPEEHRRPACGEDALPVLDKTKLSAAPPGRVFCQQCYDNHDAPECLE